MTTFTVSNLNDSGAGSLRAAIQAANADTTGTSLIINFSISGTIQLSTALPNITNSVTINATTAPSYASSPIVELNFNGNSGLVFSGNSSGSILEGLALGNASGNGVTLVSSHVTINQDYIGLHANGSIFSNGGDGIFVANTSANNNIGSNPGVNGAPAVGVVSNIISGNHGNGISLNGSSGNIIIDNHIGTSVDGSFALANGLNGILVANGSSNNTIGGTAFTDPVTGQQNNPTGNKGTITPTFVTPALGNLISGNTQNGVYITNNSQNNVLSGNFIGTNASGLAAVGNGADGVLISGANNNSLIGCQFVNNPFVYYNVVSGNGLNGLQVTNSNNITVQANFFGIGATNSSIVANGANGIQVDGSSQNVQVGGVIPLGNVSAGNKLNGIYVTDTASGFITFNTFGGLYAFGGAAPNGNDGILLNSIGGNNTLQTNVFSGNLNNGIELSGNATGVTVTPNIAGLNTIGKAVLPNGNNGLLITGNANNNTIAGTQASVIPQNTFSGNAGYGVAITGSAHDNILAQAVVGADVGIKNALGNISGGVLLATTGGNNIIGSATSSQANYIGGNYANGVTITQNSAGNQIINNNIGTDQAGLPVLPNQSQGIALNGSFSNFVTGNQLPITQSKVGLPNPQPTIGLPPQQPLTQIEALYVGYYGRAGDYAGLNYWNNNVLTQLTSGLSLGAAINIISASFAQSPENAPYNALANTPLSSSNPAQVALATSFIRNVYQNAFGRTADVGGLAYWLNQLFSGQVSFSTLVPTIENGAAGADQSTLYNKDTAAAYFSLASQSSVLSPSAFTNAVSGITTPATVYASEAVTNALTGKVNSQQTFSTAYTNNTFIVTGVRGEYNGNVVLTGTHPGGSSSDVASTAALYFGPIQNTASGTLNVLAPQFANESVTTSTFYGPNTTIFNPSLGAGNVVAVGSYQYSQSNVLNHGMIYQGPVSGGGTWTQIDVPSNLVGGAVVNDTIAHSVMGDLVVGNYDLKGQPASGNAFIYNMATKSWTVADAPFGGQQTATTLYGVWQNGIGSTSYTLAGGSTHLVSTAAGTIPLQQAFLVNYNSATGTYSNLTWYPSGNVPTAISHFEGITGIQGGYNLVATTANGPAYVTVTLNADGTFGAAQWTMTNEPGTNQAQTGNSIYQNYSMGIYTLTNSSGATSSSTYTDEVDQATVNSSGGLIMKMGSLEYNYGLTVAASSGATIVGSALTGNILGGSIGNDVYVGAQNASSSDTIYTGGGADQVLLAANRVASTHIELYAVNQINSSQTFTPGQTMPSLAGSIVSSTDIPQLGWWGQATGQVGGPTSNATTNNGFGFGTSADMTLVSNYITGQSAALDTIDVSLSAFSNLLRSSTGSSPTLGNAIISNAIAPGGTITTANADVILLSGNYKNAADVAQSLSKAATSINFASSQINPVDHYIVAYNDTLGNARIADLDIHNTTPFINTANVATLAVSDMVQLTGVNVTTLSSGNIQFAA